MASLQDNKVQTPPQETHESKKGTKKGGSRGSSFTPTEDEAIAKAWISASEDPIIGTDQKGSDFYTSIQQLYNDKFKPANRERRSMDSVKNRCRAIHKECMLFSGCHSRVIRSHPTGVSPSDILNMATALYNGAEINNPTDDCGKPFRFLGSWQILRRHDKFMATAECKGKVSKTSGSKETSNTEIIDVDDGSGESESISERPVGRKRAKEAKKRKEDSAKKMRIAAESVAAQKERNKALNRHFEIMLFTNAPPGCSTNEAAEYFNIMRARALKALREEEQQNALKDDMAPSTTEGVIDETNEGSDNSNV